LFYIVVADDEAQAGLGGGVGFHDGHARPL
jgi:hypothetical protein